ncbi:MAG: GNAT family N-acetyltransferase [Erythrobacter sp.]|uniref:GNAT family N-acetyltransferase n=1 Tax=Erythrobacter sp. TaxID=1042 RepID=UPI0025D4208B|nr:GNAT family N-acetyltransferase [Erythrobacter sp.]MCM0000692.1 GNAT family N-acetyltransferase [Erythrobacter sp.]
MIGLRLDRAALDNDHGLREGLLALNNRSALETSWLEPARFDHMVMSAFAALYVPETQALLLTFDQRADYDSPNFLWFRDRFERFVYVDRIVVDAAARGLGLARKLYEQLFDLALEAGHDLLACEVNSQPPNPGSDAFHAAMGFVEAGSAALTPEKTVRYLTRPLG